MTTDERMIQRCIKLAEDAVRLGDSPFGALVAKGSKIIVESTNRMKLDNDISAHAEILVIRAIQRKLGHSNLSAYTLYSNCEPCPMCSFMIREAKFRKVVFALSSRHMGGLNKWNILKDSKLEEFTPFFSKPPVIKSNVLEHEALKTFKKLGWNKMF